MGAILSTRQLRKSYHAIEAVRGVDLDVAEGEVHAICGDNGAGKSTVVKLISGADTPDSGTITFAGRERRFASPHDALAAGIATIYQELAVVPRMAIYQNVFLGSEIEKRVLGFKFLAKKAMRRQSRSYLRELQSTLENMRALVEDLSGGQRQAVAISRALRWQARVIILDEPTAALGVRETAVVLDLIRQLKQRGTTVILVSHNMNDVVAVADRVSVLHTGQRVATLLAAELSADSLAALIRSGHAGQTAREASVVCAG